MKIPSYNESFDATQYGYSCIQQNSPTSANPLDAVARLLGEIWDLFQPAPPIPQDEDCA
jgi:acetylcholinesterase